MVCLLFAPRSSSCVRVIDDLEKWLMDFDSLWILSVTAMAYNREAVSRRCHFSLLEAVDPFPMKGVPLGDLNQSKFVDVLLPPVLLKSG